MDKLLTTRIIKRAVEILQELPKRWEAFTDLDATSEEAAMLLFRAGLAERRIFLNFHAVGQKQTVSCRITVSGEVLLPDACRPLFVVMEDTFGVSAKIAGEVKGDEQWRRSTQGKEALLDIDNGDLTAPESGAYYLRRFLLNILEKPVDEEGLALLLPRSLRPASPTRPPITGVFKIDQVKQTTLSTPVENGIEIINWGSGADVIVKALVPLFDKKNTEEAAQLKSTTEELNKSINQINRKKKAVGSSRNKRDAAAERLKRELIEMYRASLVSLESTGNLLPVPSQYQLAKQIEVSQSTVSRIFKESPELKVMFDGLADEQYVCRFGKR